MPPAVAAPPPTPAEPVTEVLHGVEVTDPYRWLEDQNSPRTREWLEKQTVYARKYLDAIPDRSRIRQRVQQLLAVEGVSELWKVGDRYFYLKRLPYKEQPAIVMREGEFGEETILIDPTTQTHDDATTVKIMNVSNDARLLAYATSTGADSRLSVGFIDVDRKQILPDLLPRSSCVHVVLSPDRRGFYYSRQLIDTPTPDDRAAYWHKFGTEPRQDIELFVARDSSQLMLLASSDCRRLGYLVSHISDSTAFDFYIHDICDKMRVRKLLSRIKPLFHPILIGNDVLALTDWKAPNRRLVAIDPDCPDRDNWLDVIPESQYCIKYLQFVGRSICVCYIVNASSRLEIFDRSGRRQRMVPCPPQGTAQPLSQSVEGDTLLYTFSSFRQPPTVFSYHIPSDAQRIWAESSVPFDESSVEVEQIRYTSKDGTKIPMFLVARKGWRLSIPRPAFLAAYGGFGIVRTPQFNAYSTFLIEHGFLFAFANLRGGGEFGEEWHRAARRHNRQKAFDDFIAAAEWLIAEGYAVPDRLAIGGGSNAGLLVGAALTQRPDLFRVVICMGPLLDMLRYHRFDSALRCIDEFGTAELEADFRHLLAYSPYHRVKHGIRYPSVMFISGDEDTCCNPMHARKMAAYLQAASSSGRPVILDYKHKWGHIPVQPLTQRINALTDRLAFICHEMEVSV